VIYILIKGGVYLRDINIVIKDAFGRETKANTNLIEEDVLRMLMGLEPHEQDGE
jgi:hypothetical protein